MKECKCKLCGKTYKEFESIALESEIYCSYKCEENDRTQMNLFNLNVKEV